MPCGGCGGGDTIKVDKRPTTIKPARARVTPILRPSPTKKIIAAAERKPVFNRSTTVSAKKRAAAVRICPVCGAPLKLVMSGSGARRRSECARCGQIYVL